jgi:hypothetical protein
MHLPDPKSLPRVAVAGSLVAAPLALLVSSLASPPLGGDEATELANVAAHRNGMYAFALFSVIGCALVVPAFVGIMNLLRDRSPWLGYLGGGLACIGAFVAVGDSTLSLAEWEMAAPGMNRTSMTTLLHGLDATPGLANFFNVGGLGIVLGSLLAGIGLWRAQVAPRWAAAALPAATILNIVGFAAASVPLLVASCLLLLVAFAPLAVTYAGVEPFGFGAAPVGER